jgi:hypothetical protein
VVKLTFTRFDETETGRNQYVRVFGSFELLFGNFPLHMPYHVPARDWEVGNTPIYESTNREVLAMNMGLKLRFATESLDADTR